MSLHDNVGINDLSRLFSPNMIIGGNMCPRFWQCPRVRLGYLCLNMMFTYLKVMLPDGLMP